MIITSDVLEQAYVTAVGNLFREKDFFKAFDFQESSFKGISIPYKAAMMLKGIQSMTSSWDELRCMAYLIAYVESEAANYYNVHKGSGKTYLDVFFEQSLNDEGVINMIRSLVIKYSNDKESSYDKFIFCDAIKGILKTSHTSKISGDHLDEEADKRIERLFDAKYNNVESSVPKSEIEELGEMIDKPKDETLDVSIPPGIKVR